MNIPQKSSVEIPDGKNIRFSTISSQILLEIVSTMEFAFTWGYRWRKPYSGMKDNEEVRTLKFCMLNIDTNGGPVLLDSI